MEGKTHSYLSPRSLCQGPEHSRDPAHSGSQWPGSGARPMDGALQGLLQRLAVPRPLVCEAAAWHGGMGNAQGLQGA